MLAWSSPSEAKNAYGYGFEFGETPAAQGIAEWDAYLKKKLVARGFRGPRMKPKTTMPAETSFCSRTQVIVRISVSSGCGMSQ